MNDLEEKLYKKITKNSTERVWLIYKNFQKITESIVNEMVYTDIRLLTEEGKTPWVTINMDSLYNIRLDHIKIKNEDLKLILPRSKEDILKKIINCNIIVTTLHRYDKVFIYNKLKEDLDFELKEKINFTKGYIVCIDPIAVDIMKKYEYYKKTISNKKVEILTKKNTIKTKEYFKNENYSNPIWIRNDSIVEIEKNKIKILNNTLNEELDIKDFVENINFLNKIELSINKKTIKNIYNFIDKRVDIQNLYINKNKLIENIYKINEKGESISIGEDLSDIDFQKMANSASMLEIIKKQTNRFKKFYINNNYDSRLRIYAQTWPVNYQLNHIIRASIIINSKTNVNKTIYNFNNNKIVKENYIKCQDSLLNKLNKEVLILFENFINKKMNWKENIELKKECLIMILCRISSNKIKDLNEKTIFGLNNYNSFMNSNMTKNWEEWEKKLSIKKNKAPYIISLKENLKKIEKDDFSETYWLDASSNAIQLIALRMGCKNEKLLMLTNIIENKTKYENIYEYVTEKIKEKDHKDLIEKINYKLNREEINSLRDKDDSKYLIMPACYGMGKYKNRKNNEEKLKNNQKWNELEIKDKNKITDYFWNQTFEILKEIEFDLEKYKKICNSYKDYDAFMWKNDIGMTLAPINILKSKRQEILKKINELKMKNKEKNCKKIEDKINELKVKIKKDEKDFWKRTMINIKRNKNEKKIFIRIPNPSKKLDKRLTLQALTPNTIHAYDASIMFLCIIICREIGIEILVIHDCIGCKLINAPIVKKIFKIANIEILKKTLNKKPFPLKEYKIGKDEIEELKKKILESTNFFR